VNPLPESTINLLLSGLMGLAGGLVTIPLNACVSWVLKRDEQLYQHRLDRIAKQRELLLEHKLEMERMAKDDRIARLEEAIARLEQRFADE
jgi:hypothetical protein